MKSILKIKTLKTSKDVIEVKESIATKLGVIACEVNINKQEANILYDDLVVSLDNLIEAVEEIGHVVE